MVRSLTLVAVGHSVIFLAIVTPLAMAIDSGVVAGPIMQEAPLSARLRAADCAACGSPWVSAETSLTSISKPAAFAALLASSIASLVALAMAGAVTDMGPVLSSRSPITSVICAARASIAVRAARATPAARAVLRTRIIGFPPPLSKCQIRSGTVQLSPTVARGRRRSNRTAWRHMAHLLHNRVKVIGNVRRRRHEGGRLPPAWVAGRTQLRGSPRARDGARRLPSCRQGGLAQWLRSHGAARHSRPQDAAADDPRRRYR